MNRGFTLVEVILILVFMMVFSGLVEMNRMDSTMLYWNMKRMENFLVFKKKQAFLNKEKIELVVQDNKVIDDTDTLLLHNDILCERYRISFNERGNVDRAGTITCTYNNYANTMKIHLGNGDIYVSE